LSIPREPRLRAKKAFCSYYVELCASGVADPGPAYEAFRLFVSSRSWGEEPSSARRELEEELQRMEGEVEQDLRWRYVEAAEFLAAEPLGLRFQECMEYAWRAEGLSV